MVSTSSCVSFWYRPCYKNMFNYDNNSKCQNLKQLKSRFFYKRADTGFPSSTNLVTKVKGLSPNFKQIT